MSHEDYLEPEELDKMREQYKESPQRKTSVQTETSDLDTIGSLLNSKRETELAITKLAASLQARLNLLNEVLDPPTNRSVWLTIKERILASTGILTRACNSTTCAVACYLVLLLIGVGIGYFVWSAPQTHEVRPTPVVPVIVPVQETLEEFAARESAMLTADERKKLIAVAEKILQGHFDTPEAIEEEFVYQRRLAGIDSPAFNDFRAKWSAKAKEMKLEDSAEAMRRIYGSLLRGLKVQAYSDFSDISGEPVEGFLSEVSPSNVTSLSTDEDVPVPPVILPSQTTPTIEGKPPLEQETETQRQRVFRRR